MLTKVLAPVLVVLIGLALGIETARYVHAHATGVDASGVVSPLASVEPELMLMPSAVAGVMAAGVTAVGRPDSCSHHESRQNA